MKKLLALLLLSPLVYSQSATEILNVTGNGKAEITVERKKAFLYSALKVRVRANDLLVAKVGNGKTEKFNISEGLTTFAVSGFGAPGESTVTFRVKAGESYKLAVASRKSNFWSGIVGGALGVGLIWSSALEASMQSTEGGPFGIALIGTSETESSSMTEPEEKPKTNNLEEVYYFTCKNLNFEVSNLSSSLIIDIDNKYMEFDTRKVNDEFIETATEITAIYSYSSDGDGLAFKTEYLFNKFTGILNIVNNADGAKYFLKHKCIKVAPLIP